jgi:ribose/xylose/arabinose/galactoside ABC-type transport system permease subunit
MSLARVNWRELFARFGLVMALVALVVILSLLSDRFLTPRTSSTCCGRSRSTRSSPAA